MSEERLDDCHSTNRTARGDLEWKPNSLEEAEAPMQALALDLCTPIASEAQWSDNSNSNVWCSCGPDLPAEKSTEWISHSPKSGLWDSCERKYGSADSIPGKVNSEMCQDVDCYSLSTSTSRSFLRSQKSGDGNEYKCFSNSKDDTPLHTLLHKIRPWGPRFQFRKKRKMSKAAGKSLVTAFQSFNISGLSHDRAVHTEYRAEGDRFNTTMTLVAYERFMKREEIN